MKLLASHADFATIEYVLDLYPSMVHLRECRHENSLLRTAIEAGRQDTQTVNFLVEASPTELTYGGESLSELAEKKGCGPAVVATLVGLTREQFDKTKLFLIIQTSMYEEFQRQVLKRDPEDVVRQLSATAEQTSYTAFHALIFSNCSSALVMCVLDRVGAAGRSKLCSLNGFKCGYPLLCLIGTKAGADIEIVKRMALAFPEAVDIEYKDPYKRVNPNGTPWTSESPLQRALRYSNRSAFDLSIYRELDKIRSDNDAVEIVATTTPNDRLRAAELAGDVIEISSDDEKEKEDEKEKAPPPLEPNVVVQLVGGMPSPMPMRRPQMNQNRPLFNGISSGVPPGVPLGIPLGIPPRVHLQQQQPPPGHLAIFASIATIRNPKLNSQSAPKRPYSALYPSLKLVANSNYRFGSNGEDRFTAPPVPIPSSSGNAKATTTAENTNANANANTNYDLRQNPKKKKKKTDLM
ncbi:hypothetical protein TL16_g12726 [Triparma laevis f. inornata]|uniref:Uncharacterized protein n=1 Tax=Triparma laevis f. inornata TaxID=1714386 RepID=A0A9W7BNV7_9STRA|nr:hypothetical protein TL16_g12726 [Triparma laevis f. inornata]